VNDLDAALRELAPPGVKIGWRKIAEGDEDALLAGDEIYSKKRKVLRASGAARIVARELLGRPDLAIPKGWRGDPQWPPGVVGSLAHDDGYALAAIAPVDRYAGIGIDIENAQPFLQDAFDLVVTMNEREAIRDDPQKATYIFSIKEAVYKAVYPIDRVFLEFWDIEVDLEQGVAVTKTGRTVTFRYAVTPTHVVALAYA
jgi:4'-phosphopantetheinyl transferase EntD